MRVLGAFADFGVQDSRILWDNDPSLAFYVDDLPDCGTMRHKMRHGLYLAIDSGYAHWIYKENPKVNDDGYGGRHTHVIMEDGNKVEWNGGWSSNSHSINHWFPESKVIECSWYMPYYGTMGLAGGCTIEFAQQQIQAYNLPIEIREEMFYGKMGPVVALRGLPSKNERDRDKIMSREDYVFPVGTDIALVNLAMGEDEDNTHLRYDYLKSKPGREQSHKMLYQYMCQVLRIGTQNDWVEGLCKQAEDDPAMFMYFLGTRGRKDFEDGSWIRVPPWMIPTFKDMGCSIQDTLVTQEHGMMMRSSGPWVRKSLLLSNGGIPPIISD